MITNPRTHKRKTNKGNKNVWRIAIRIQPITYNTLLKMMSMWLQVNCLHSSLFCLHENVCLNSRRDVFNEFWLPSSEIHVLFLCEDIHSNVYLFSKVASSVMNRLPAGCMVVYKCHIYLEIRLLLNTSCNNMWRTRI